MNKQRTAIYQWRKRVLVADAHGLDEELSGSLDISVSGLILAHAGSPYPGEWNHEELAETLQAILGPVSQIHEHLQKLENEDELRIFLKELLMRNALERKKKLEEPAKVVRAIILQAIDTLWIDHLEAMDYMRSSVRLRAYGQRDPLVEYKNEGARMFQTLEQHIHSYIAESIFKVSAEPKQKQFDQSRIQLNNPSQILTASDKVSLSQGAAKPVVKNPNEPGRNDPCFCGSGKKYKKCHGK
jgi:preprotein translocase subunit SecA